MNNQPTQPEQPSFAPGTLVINTTRMPPVLQPWFHDIYVGTVEVPNQEVGAWAARFTEEEYCQRFGKIKVRYDSGVAYEDPIYLVAITPEQAALPHREKIALFMGEEALANYDRCNGPQFRTER